MFPPTGDLGDALPETIQTDGHTDNKTLSQNVNRKCMYWTGIVCYTTREWNLQPLVKSASIIIIFSGTWSMHRLAR